MPPDENYPAYGDVDVDPNDDLDVIIPYRCAWLHYLSGANEIHFIPWIEKLLDDFIHPIINLL